MIIVFNILTVFILLFSMYLFGKIGDKIKNKTVYMLFGAIIMLGFTLRLLAIILIDCMPFSDYNTMYSAGASFANGVNQFKMGSYFQRFPHMTTFSVVCGFLMKIFGTNVFVIKIFSVIFKTVAIFAAGLLGRQLYGNKGLLCASFMYAVFLPDIFYTPVLASENFAITFILFSLCYFIKAFKSECFKDTLINTLLCGAILSVGCLLRGVAPFYLCAFSAGIVLCFKSFKKKGVSLIALFISYLIVFNLVSMAFYDFGITEYKLSDKGEPYIVYILVGSNFETNGMYSAEDHGVYLDAGENPEKASEIATEKLFKRLSENPEKIIPLLLKKTDIIWSDGSFNSLYWSMIENGLETDNPIYPICQSMCKTMYYTLLLLSLLFVIFYDKRKITIILLLIPLAFEGGLMLMEIQPRYTFSAAYVFAIMGALGACKILDKFNRKIGESHV